jgi:hypothetical protein
VDGTLATRKKVVPMYPTRQHIRVEIRRRRKLIMGGLKENQNSGGQEAAPVIRSEVVEAYGQWMVAKKAGRKISKISDSREISRPRNLRRFPQKARSESDLMEGNKEINGAKGSRFNFLREDNVEIIMAEKANNKYQGVDVNSGK